MKYHLNRQGRELGCFPLDELRRRREAGELTGTELVWCEGMPAWEPLDAVLRVRPPEKPGLTPPPLPAGAVPRKANEALIWTVLVGGVLVAAVVFFLVVNAARLKRHPRQDSRQTTPQAIAEAISKAVTRSISQMHAPTNSQEGVAEASKPVLAGTNTMTVENTLKRAKEFRVRQWLEGYRERGQRDQPCDAEAVRFIEAWIAHNFDTPPATNAPSPHELSNQLAADPACTDPLVLTVAAVNSLELHESVRRLERALRGFEQSRHRAYPKFYATVRLADTLVNQPDRRAELDLSAAKLFKECFADGSFLPRDEAEIAEILANGWGERFFKRREKEIHAVPAEFGKPFAWLTLVLAGEFHVDEAWRLRGVGFANSVTADGWQGFSQHLALAREALTKAWNLRPDLPLAPARMITVAMGDTGADEMRLWFDRATMAQIDYPAAWSNLRWGLRPRWHGSLNAVMALGVTAVNTGRFDTDVPRTLFDSVTALETDTVALRGQHLYGRDDIWPHLQRMYEGYLAEPSQAATRRGWRSVYAAIAYQAGRLDVARAQLEAVNWDPLPIKLTGWGRDLSLLPLEVAARTGGLRKQVEAAESSRTRGDLAQALKLYQEMEASRNADVRTRTFIRHRLAALAMEERMSRGDWVDFLPATQSDLNWMLVRGKSWRLVDGVVEVQAGAGGHILRSRVPVGDEFEVKGEFEVVRSSTKDFQAGLVMGVPDYDSQDWYGFRVKRNTTEGDIACISTHWGNERFFKPMKLNSDRNTFQFVLQAHQISAFVNDQPVCMNVKPPRFLNVPADQFYLGVGAYNDMNDTVIRYRNLQVRSAKVRPPRVRKR